MRRVPKLSFAQGQLMLWILTGSIVAFGSMFLFFRVSGVSLATAPREVPRINFMPTTRQDPLLAPGPAYVVADVFDPSLMSLPSPHGFSKRVWARKIEAGQRDLGWNQQPAFLGVKVPGVPPPLLQPVPVDAAVLTAVEKTPALSEESNDNELPEVPILINRSNMNQTRRDGMSKVPVEMKRPSIVEMLIGYLRRPIIFSFMYRTSTSILFILVIFIDESEFLIFT